MLASAGDPTPDGGVGELEDASGCLRTEAFGDGVQHLGDLYGWGLEAVERGVAPGRDLAVAGLTIQVLDRVMPAVVAVTN